MANGGRSGRGGSRVLAGFEMEHCGRVAFPLALRLGATSEPPGCKCAEPPFAALPPCYHSTFAVSWAACQACAWIPAARPRRGRQRSRALPQICPRSAAVQTPRQYEVEAQISARSRRFWRRRRGWPEGHPHAAVGTPAGLDLPLSSRSPVQRVWLQHHQPKSGCSPRVVICVRQS